MTVMPAAPSVPCLVVDLSREECLRLLGTAAVVGRVVALTAAETPVIRPVNFVFDERSQSVVFRCSGGTKLISPARRREGLVEVDEIDPARRTGWSVIIAAVTEPVTQRHEVARLERLALHSWRCRRLRRPLDPRPCPGGVRLSDRGADVRCCVVACVERPAPSR